MRIFYLKEVSWGGGGGGGWFNKKSNVNYWTWLLCGLRSFGWSVGGCD